MKSNDAMRENTQKTFCDDNVKISQLELELDTIKNRSDKNNKEYERILVELNTVKENKEKIWQQLVEHKQIMATSEKQIKEKEDCINQINESLKDIKSQRNALQQTLDAEQKQAQMQQEKLTAEISTLMAALKTLEEQNRDISHQLASSELAAKQELERLWTEVSEKRNLESKFTEQSHKLEELQILLSLNKENAGDTITLQQLKEENRTARLRITETEIKLIEYQQQIQTLEQHIEKK